MGLQPKPRRPIGSVGGTALKGTLSFRLYDSADCSGTVLRPAESFSIDQASPVTRETTNTDVFVKVSKTVSWGVNFASDNPLVDGSFHCEKTQLTITN